jgi:hypothetical protein
MSTAKLVLAVDCSVVHLLQPAQLSFPTGRPTYGAIETQETVDGNNYYRALSTVLQKSRLSQTLSYDNMS